LKGHDILVVRGDKQITATSGEADFNADKISLTNVVSSVDPMAVCQVISPRFVAALAPFHFFKPPQVQLNGSFSVHDPAKADLHFDVTGEQFKWTNLVADKIAGHIDWMGGLIRLTNVHANFYGNGQAKGWGEFRFEPRQPERGVDCKFDVSAVDISLPLAGQSITGKTNRLEGMCDAHLTITGGNTRDKQRWQGYGRANVHDAVLWEIPIFGIFSPVLNAIAPGAGNSRAREASATFIITNSLVYSDDLEIKSLAFRLQYHGGIDASAQVIDARVEAELLRDAWVIGKIVSFALTPLSKLFEYHITGPLKEPKMEPTYIPKFLMMTLRPFHTLKTLTAPDTPENKNNENFQPATPK
jgi:hypothetical protein